MKMKQVIVVRQDLNMSSGKMAAQCCHASVSAALASKKAKISNWTESGQKKIVLQVQDEESMTALKKKCDTAKIVSCIISDAGLTEVKRGTITALGIGPAKEQEIDKVTGSLPLLK